MKKETINKIVQIIKKRGLAQTNNYDWQRTTRTNTD